MKDFIKAVITKSVIGKDEVHVGVLQFSTIQQQEFPLNQYYSKEEMSRAIDAMQQIGGGTLTGEAIAEVTKYFDAAEGGRPDLKQRLVVITDGESQDEVKGPAEALRAKGVVVYAIGVVDANTTQLLEISGLPDRVYAERDFDALKDLESQVALEICDPDRGKRGLRLFSNPEFRNIWLIDCDSFCLFQYTLRFFSTLYIFKNQKPNEEMNWKLALV